MQYWLRAPSYLSNFSLLCLRLLILSFYIAIVSSTPIDSRVNTTSDIDTAHETVVATATPGPEKQAYEQRWVSRGQRGTSDLLLSCFATIGLAVWSSIILNIQMTPDAIIKGISRSRPSGADLGGRTEQVSQEHRGQVAHDGVENQRLVGFPIASTPPVQLHSN